MLINRTTNGVAYQQDCQQRHLQTAGDKCRSTITVILQIDRIYVRESAVLFSNRKSKWLLICYGLNKYADFFQKPPIFLIKVSETSQTTGGVSDPRELSVMFTSHGGRNPKGGLSMLR